MRCGVKIAKFKTRRRVLNRSTVVAQKKYTSHNFNYSIITMHTRNLSLLASRNVYVGGGVGKYFHILLPYYSALCLMVLV